jgi:hypothetical protein
LAITKPINSGELPEIWIETRKKIKRKKKYVEASIRFKGKGDFDNIEKEGLIRPRGNSTMTLPKLPYQIKFETETSIAGMPAERKWVLLANYSDKTLLRNYLGLLMGQHSKLEWTPNFQFVEVYINQQYQGNYLLTEKIEPSEARLNIAPNDFLLEITDKKRAKKDDVIFTSGTGIVFEIKHPEDLSRRSDKFRYIKDYIDQTEDALYRHNLNSEENGYRNYIDIEQFVDWYLINEIARNVDANFSYSVYMHHKIGEKIKLGPIWDFDIGFGNADYYDSWKTEGFRVADRRWPNRMLQDTTLKKQIAQRFEYFKEKMPYFLEQVKLKADQMDASQLRNFQKWPILGEKVWPNYVAYNTYQEEVDHLINWVEERMKWLDQQYKPYR